MSELVDLVKKSKKSCLIFKVDFEKAYNSVSWSFLDYVLSHFGYNDKLRSCIRVCVFYGNLAVLVNGFRPKKLASKRGLKQGDPLTPFLFLLVVEGLSGWFSRDVDQ